MQVRGDTRGDGEPGFMSVYERALINAHEGRPSAISADTPAAGIEMITGRSTQTSSLRSEERRVGKEGRARWGGGRGGKRRERWERAIIARRGGRGTRNEYCG